jgi:hypothetical protein
MSEKLTARRVSLGQKDSVPGMMISFAMRGEESVDAVIAAMLLPRSIRRVRAVAAFVTGVISVLARHAISRRWCETFSHWS